MLCEWIHQGHPRQVVLAGPASAIGTFFGTLSQGFFVILPLSSLAHRKPSGGSPLPTTTHYLSEEKNACQCGQSLYTLRLTATQQDTFVPFDTNS